ncbi:MAG: hypothetical protein HZA66_01080 [Rhodopseudomonas palustris]|uniref:Uncharacterized protein n=1 Tax=Rhodopseudomonas palustris TaxID=1076 RepID=A0A933RVC9_RHOPL|nr:hypothetical protein [Rhodopseudomonas palustris]
MTQITRVFDNPSRANAALDELRSRGFTNAELIAGAEGRGKTTLQVEAPFGTAVRVEQILKRHANGSPGAAPTPAAATAKPAIVTAPTPPQPPNASPPSRLAATKPEPATPQPARTAAAPRNGSDAIRRGPRTLSQLLGIPELIDSDTFFSGFPLLIRPTPKRADEPPVKRT